MIQKSQFVNVEKKKLLILHLCLLEKKTFLPVWELKSYFICRLEIAKLFID